MSKDVFSEVELLLGILERRAAALATGDTVGTNAPLVITDCRGSSDKKSAPEGALVNRLN